MAVRDSEMIFEFKLETVTNRPIETATPVKISNPGGGKGKTHIATKFANL